MLLVCKARALEPEVLGRGEPLLLLQPRGYDRRFWSELLPHLTGNYCCVIADLWSANASDGVPARVDLLTELKCLVDGLAWTSFGVIAVGGSVDIALALACEEQVGVRAELLINPTIREYMDPRSAQYLGTIVEDDRRSALVLAKEGPAWLRPGLPGQDAAGLSRWQLTVRSMIADLGAHSGQLRVNLAIHVVERLGRMECPVTLALVTQPGTRAGALSEMVARLEVALPAAEVVKVVSPWSVLLPLAEPKVVAELLAQTMARS